MTDRFAPARHRRRLLLAGAASWWPPAITRAQSPRPLRLIVPFPPGGSTDLLARALQPRLQAALGVPVLVDNKPGAGGTIGAAEAARAAPDGQTLLMGHVGTLAVNPSIYPTMAYDPVKSFVAIAWVARVPNVLVAHAGLPLRRLPDLVERAQAQPGRMTYSSGGNGSAAHVTFEALKLRARIFLLHIPYRGTAPSVADVIAGQVDCTFTGSPAVLPHLRSGRLRALAVSSPQRLAVLPEVPTVAEAGYPGFEADQWYGLVAPAGTPSERVARINEIVNRALALPEVANALAAEGAVPTPGTPEAFGELIRQEIPRWRAVVKAAKVEPG